MTTPWQGIDHEALTRPYKKYFEPAFLAHQAERLDPGLDVDRLHPITIPGPEGPLGTLYLDDTGQVALAAPYPSADRFSEGLAAVATGVTQNQGIVDYGYIDRTGGLAIEPIYELAFPFREGLAPVQKGGRSGYIDREGRLAIPFRYWSAEEFRDGIARVWLDQDHVQFIDRAGKVLYAAESWSVGEFSEGLLFATHVLPSTPNHLEIAWGYLDRDFHHYAFFLDPDRFGRCEEFHDGLAAIELSRGNPIRWGFLSREGEVVIEGPYPQVERFSEGLAAVNVSRGPIPRWGYIDKAGTMVIEPRFLETTPFSEGLAAVLVPIDEVEKGDEGGADRPTPEIPLGRWGYIDRRGEMVIQPNFFGARPFEDELARVEENPYVDGFIDHAGTYVWKLTEPKSP